MTSSIRKYLNPQYFSLLGCWLMLLSLCLSPAGMSIGTGLLLAGALWAAWEKRHAMSMQHGWIVGCFAAYFLWIVLTIFWTEDRSLYASDVRIKLPFLLLPLAFALIPAFSQKQKLGLWISFCLSQLLIALLSIAGYMQNMESSIEQVKKNGSLEIVGQTNHIYFGVSLALACLVGFHIYLNHKDYFPKIYRKFALVFVILAALCLHSLTSRTGLVAFYGGFFVYLMRYILKRGQWKWGLGILALLVLLPLLSYKLIPSFKYRVDVTLWDLAYSQEEGADLNFQSVGLRLKTWDCSLDLFQKNPLLGVGFGDMGKELFACYEEMKLNADRSKWLESAHNQYLEQLAGGGLPALLLLLLLFLIPFRQSWKKPDEMMLGFLALMAAGMLTESLLERQLGVNLFLLMYFLWLKKNDS